MKSIRSVSTFLSLLAVFAFSVASGQSGEKKIAKKDIPAPVMKAFTGQYPHAVIKGQALETEKGKTFYEIESVDGKTSRDLRYTAEGKVVEIEESVDPSALSNAMKAAITKEYPNGRIVKAEQVTEGTSVTYEIAVRVGKETKEVRFDVSGNLLKAGKAVEAKDEKEEDEDDDDE